MFCSNCGNMLNENDNFCNKCGYKVERKEEILQKNIDDFSISVNDESRNEEKSNSPWGGFAKAGCVMGILGVIPYMGLLGFPLLGIVFSILGVFSENRKGRAITGIVLSAIGIVELLIIISLIEEF